MKGCGVLLQVRKPRYSDSHVYQHEQQRGEQTTRKSMEDFRRVQLHSVHEDLSRPPAAVPEKEGGQDFRTVRLKPTLVGNSPERGMV